MKDVIRAAMQRAQEAMNAEAWPTKAHVVPSRWVAIGDPQASMSAFFTVLDRHDLLAEDGTLRPEVGLVSMGDHFDFFWPSLEEAERSGRGILAWLAAHPSTQTLIVFGNHDAARVMELAHETDESFARARAIGEEWTAAKGDEARRASLVERFEREHPHIPTPGIAARDYNSYSLEQRRLVERLLLQGRFRLAFVGHVKGTEVLFTHAAVTDREVRMLGVEPRPRAIAEALEDVLARAIDAVRSRWTEGRSAALDLGPMHVPGTSGVEGGGLLYHRPTRPDRPGDVDRTWELAPHSPRRYHPNTLPRGLAQACGHSGHERCVKELTGWYTEEVRATPHPSLRTLAVGSDGVRYELGIRPANEQEATLYLIDPMLAHAQAQHVELLDLTRA